MQRQESNGERFEEAFNRIDNYLRRKFRIERNRTFASVLDAGARDPMVKQHKDILRDFADLRNAIVHTRGVSTRILANPTDEAVFQIESLASRFERPRTLRALGVAAPIDVFGAEQSLPSVLKYMRDRDYSQVVVRIDGSYVAITNEGIARWLESLVEDDVLSLTDSKLADVFRYEPDYTYEHIAAHNPVEAALVRFRENTQRLYCLLVTEKGKREERPMKVITPWDLHNLQRAAED
jgi:hypothetical protein